MNQKTANRILIETESGYDLISKKFSQTRKHFWRGLEFIKDYSKAGDKVLDFGCGNGRLLELIGSENIQYQGVDVSGKLIEFAKQKYPNDGFSKIDPIQTTLPLENEFFNSVYSIAVFHHFPSQKYREDLAKELYRVTKSGGHVVVTVWYLWPASILFWRGKQQKYFKNILENWKNKLLGKSSLDWNDCYISFTDNEGQKIQRFHHAFTKRELAKLFRSAGFEIEKCEIPDGRNIVLIGKKK